MKSPWLFAVAAIGAVVATTGCSGSPTTKIAPGAGGAPGGISAIAFQEVYKNRYSRITTPRGEVIATPDRWQAVWDELNTEIPQPALPAIDFGAASVLVAAMGENADACWDIAIEGVRSQSSRVHVTVTSIRSHSSCSCPPVIVQPVHAVSIPIAIDIPTDPVIFEVGTAMRGPACN